MGDTLPIYYHPKRPTQWQTATPEEAGKTAVVVGRLLTGVGTVALIVGFILPMF
ncbi:hypothetical protein D3C85_1818860 [compost metagenome]